MPPPPPYVVSGCYCCSPDLWGPAGHCFALVSTQWAGDRGSSQASSLFPSLPPPPLRAGKLWGYSPVYLTWYNQWRAREQPRGRKERRMIKWVGGQRQSKAKLATCLTDHSSVLPFFPRLSSCAQPDRWVWPASVLLCPKGNDGEAGGWEAQHTTRSQQPRLMGPVLCTCCPQLSMSLCTPQTYKINCSHIDLLSADLPF